MQIDNVAKKLLNALNPRFTYSENEAGIFWRCKRCKVELWDRLGIASPSDKEFYSTIFLHAIGLCKEAGESCSWGKTNVKTS